MSLFKFSNFYLFSAKLWLQRCCCSCCHMGSWNCCTISCSQLLLRSVIYAIRVRLFFFFVIFIFRRHLIGWLHFTNRRNLDTIVTQIYSKKKLFFIAFILQKIVAVDNKTFLKWPIKGCRDLDGDKNRKIFYVPNIRDGCGIVTPLGSYMQQKYCWRH